MIWCVGWEDVYGVLYIGENREKLWVVVWGEV